MLTAVLHLDALFRYSNIVKVGKIVLIKINKKNSTSIKKNTELQRKFPSELSLSNCKIKN